MKIFKISTRVSSVFAARFFYDAVSDLPSPNVEQVKIAGNGGGIIRRKL